MFDQEYYLKALNFAALAHKEQKTPKGLPYLTHLSAVAMEVIHAIFESKIEEKSANLSVICALLHDVIEDTSFTYDDIFDEFGFDVAEGVDALTKDKTLPSKKKQMAESLNKLLQQPYSVQMVKLADRISNLQEPPEHWDTQKIEDYLSESKLILSCLKNANIYLSKRLEEKIEAYKKYL